jgi:hypothetical protein
VPRLLVLICALLASAAFAKPWNGIEPGVSSKDAVLKKFSDPSKVTTVSGREVLTYAGFKAIKGTVQAQFRIDPASGTVDRIDVFPEPIIDQEAIEKSYGLECAAGESDGCYVRRTQEKKPPYFLYSKLGLAIFFKEDKTVQSFAFLPLKK